MSLLSDAYKQAIVCQAYSQLGSNDDVERNRAMATLRECGDASLWALRLASRQAGQPRMQFAAAIVLHWLGNSQGMMTLTEALKWRLSSEPALAAPLEAAFLTIGSPDAVTSLLTVWNMLPDWGENEIVIATICRIWAILKNPTVIAPLTVRALLISEVFEKTMPAFGEMAITPLREMSRETQPSRRLLALRALRHIPNARSFGALIPLLYDSDLEVRSETPSALEATGGPAATLCEITRAVREGFVTPAAVSYLVRYHPDDLYDALISALECWKFDLVSRIATEALLLIVQTLSHSPLPSSRLAPVLCPLLDVIPDYDLTAEIVRTLGTLGPTQTPYDDVIRKALWKQLAASSSFIREQAAASLVRFGEYLGRRILLFLEECTPSGSLLNKLHAILRGGPDAGQAATQAVQQVSQWISRLSREGTTRLQNQSVTDPSSTRILMRDPRLPGLLSNMLESVLSGCKSSTHLAEMEEKTTFIVTLMRAFTRLELPSALLAWAAMVHALHFSYDAASIHPSICAELQETIRLTAAETWIELYGGACFPVLLEALYSPDPLIVRSAAMGLGRLGDVRALPHLERFVADTNHPVGPVARQSADLIKRTNPEIMTLLRGSAPSMSEPETLLRAASGNNTAHSTDLLLRPTAQTSD